MTRLSATDVLRSIRSHQKSALATTQHLLRAAANASDLCAYTYIASDLAEQAAEQSDSPALAQRALNGLPIIVKDNIDVAGMPTTAGSKAFDQPMSTTSASVITRLCAAGVIVLGKANLHEFSLGITSNNGAFGAVRNPYDLTRIPGGSSGGTAAAVAAGIATAGIGSDTGGSLRIPAALCGVVGFRPTTGRWASDGVVRISHTRDTVGPIACTVEDCALLDSVACEQTLEMDFVAIDSIRIGIPRHQFWDDLAPEVRLAAEQVLSRLASSGITLVECHVGFDIDECNHAGMIIAMLELFDNIEGYLAQHQLQFNAVMIGERIASPDVKGIYQSLLGEDAPSQQAYDEALNSKRPLFQKAYAACFADHQLDALIFPTTPLAAAPIGEDDTVELNGKRVPTFATYAKNVGPGSTTGLPGISLPMGCTLSGLPMGIALDGPAGSDRKLLAIAKIVESLLPAIPKPNYLAKDI